MAGNVYDLEFTTLNGHDKLKLSHFNGKLILVVNTASMCGFTKQYAQIEELWQKYKDLGLVVIGVPSNDFGKQEFDTSAEIADFCAVNFNISFILTEKTIVTGNNAHPFFKWVRENYSWFAAPKWNFYKFLIEPTGAPLAWFSSFTSPTSKKVIDVINKNLPKI